METVSRGMIPFFLLYCSRGVPGPDCGPACGGPAQRGVGFLPLRSILHPPCSLPSSPVLQAFVARILALPGETEVAELMAPADPDAIHAVARFCRTTIGKGSSGPSSRPW